MRIALVHCSPQDVGPCPSGPPLGLLALAGAARAALPGVQVGVWDQALQPDPHRLVQRIRAFEPDVVGFSALEASLPQLTLLSALARDALPRAALVAGGPAADQPHRLLERTAVDQVFSGEADLTFPRWLRAMGDRDEQTSVPGLAWREGGSFQANPPPPFVEDLDSLPEPAWDLVDPRAYLQRPSMNVFVLHPRVLPMMSGRGCPYGCSFCHHRFGRKVRNQSVERVLQTWERLERVHGAGEIHVWDDCFNADLPRMVALLEGRLARGHRARLAFPNGLRGDHLPAEVIRLMARAGVWATSFGIESASPRLQALTGKGLDLDALADAVVVSAREGLFTRGFFMVGLPGETRAEAEETLRFAMDHPFDWAMFFDAVPFPGSRIAAEHPVLHPPGSAESHYHAGRGFWAPTDQGLPAREMDRRFRARPELWRRLLSRSRRWPGFWRLNLRAWLEARAAAQEARLDRGIPAPPERVQVSVGAPPARVHQVLVSALTYRQWVQNDLVDVHLHADDHLRPGTLTHRYHRGPGLTGALPFASPPPLGVLLGTTVTETVLPDGGFVDRFVAGPIRGTHALTVEPGSRGGSVLTSTLDPRFPSPLHLANWRLMGARSHRKVVTTWMEHVRDLAQKEDTP